MLRDRLVRHPAYAGARVIGLFAAQPFEPHLDPLQHDSKRFCFPRVHQESLQFHWVGDFSTLAAERWNLREPALDPATLVPLEELDLLLVPGLAFSAAGARLGRGGGYYDRLLADPRLRCPRIGVCFADQVLEDLPLEAHDQPVDGLVTDLG